MKKTVKFFVFFLLLAFFLPVASSRASKKAPGCTLVTQVEILCHYPDQTLERTYTHPQKIASILNYLRHLHYRGKPQTDPESVAGDSYRITLYYSNGEHRVYRQHAYRFLSRNEQPWEKVDPARAGLLYPLLRLLPADG